MIDYNFLKIRGAVSGPKPEPGAGVPVGQLAQQHTPPDVLQLVPEAVARENVVFPLSFDGETVTLASCDPGNVALADRLRFLLAKNVNLLLARREEIVEAIDLGYGQLELESVSMFEAEEDLALDDSVDALMEIPAVRSRTRPASAAGKVLGGMLSPVKYGRTLGKGVVEFKKGLNGLEDGTPPYQPSEGTMFFHTVDEGQRVLMRRPDGTMDVITGPRRVWRGWNRFFPMKQFVAHPDQFLILRFRNGQQQHLPGPVDVWFDPREHLTITVQEALQIAAKEAVVVYTRRAGSDAVGRRIVFGPALFVPEPGEWLHTFTWHASEGGSHGAQKKPRGLVFQKLWMMPDQMYHDVTDVRTADDAVLTIRLMIFFELIDIERMLEATHDPIGDFVNAATSDVVAFTGKYDFEQFKRNVTQLNDLETYKQLLGRAAQCGYRINKVVYRGYGSAQALQQMHDQAIEARTRLQLDRATEQQAQDLENYKLDSQLFRAGKRREEQNKEVDHDLELAHKRQEADLRKQEAELTFQRERARLQAELQLAIRRGQDAQQREHLAALREMGVNLTEYLTQGRADKVIEVRGARGGTHVHLERMADGEKK
jgi:hypothetical protein